AEYRQGMLSFSGSEEWEQDAGLLSFGPARGICKPLTWSEEDRIPFDVDTGSRITPELGGGIRLRRAYHETETLSLKRIRGSLIYQPIDGLFLPPIEIDLSEIAKLGLSGNASQASLSADRDEAEPLQSRRCRTKGAP